jgi:putative endonuclease
MANRKNGTLYIGVTDNLVKRVWEHKNNLVQGFTEKYNIHNLVYYELHQDINEAILKEKQMKKWNRIWKIKQINKLNPNWNDLYEQITK